MLEDVSTLVARHPVLAIVYNAERTHFSYRKKPLSFNELLRVVGLRRPSDELVKKQALALAASTVSFALSMYKSVYGDPSQEDSSYEEGKREITFLTCARDSLLRGYEGFEVAFSDLMLTFKETPPMFELLADVLRPLQSIELTSERQRLVDLVGTMGEAYSAFMCGFRDELVEQMIADGLPRKNLRMYLAAMFQVEIRGFAMRAASTGKFPVPHAGGELLMVLPMSAYDIQHVDNLEAPETVLYPMGEHEVLPEEE